MRLLASIGIATLLVDYALGACTGMNAADSGVCPVSQCASLVDDFSSNDTLASSGTSALPSSAQFVSELSPDYASITGDGLTLSLVKSGSGYKGSTVYFTKWIQYGIITARIRTGSTTPGVISSLQLQDQSGTSIDMDWVGNSPSSVQANYYTENQLELSQATSASLTSNPASSFSIYKIVWLPDSLTWYANGFAVRTVNRMDTWAEGEQRFKYPSSASRLSFSIWSASDASNPELTQQWAGSIPSTSTETQFSMTIARVQVDCYTNATDAAKSPDSPQSSASNDSSFVSPKSITEVDLSNFGLSSQESTSSLSSSTMSTEGSGNGLSRWLAEQDTPSGARPVHVLEATTCLLFSFGLAIASYL